MRHQRYRSWWSLHWLTLIVSLVLAAVVMVISWLVLVSILDALAAIIELFAKVATFDASQTFFAQTLVAHVHRPLPLRALVGGS